MVPDYDYTLLFPAAARDAVLEGLKPLCDDGSRDRLASTSSQARVVEMELSLRSLPDMPPDVVDDFPRLPDGTSALGNVYLTVGPSSWLEFPDAVVFRLWPCTRRLQRACIGSMLLRGELVRLLERHGGHVGYIVNTSCDPVEFWHRCSGRSNDGHPAEYVLAISAEPEAPSDRLRE